MAKPAPASALHLLPHSRDRERKYVLLGSNCPISCVCPPQPAPLASGPKTGPADASGPCHQKKGMKNNHQDRATGRTRTEPWGTMWRADTLPLRLCPILVAAGRYRTFLCARLALFELAMQLRRRNRRERYRPGLARCRYLISVDDRSVRGTKQPLAGGQTAVWPTSQTSRFPEPGPGRRSPMPMPGSG